MGGYFKQSRANVKYAEEGVNRAQANITILCKGLAHAETMLSKGTLGPILTDGTENLILHWWMMYRTAMNK